MYDINVFLENRSEIIKQLERLEFNLEIIGDHAHESFEFEIDMGNVSLVVDATIMETFVDFTRESRNEPADYVFERDFNEINEAYYITSEGDEIPCTESEIKAIENVIKSLL